MKQFILAIGSTLVLGFSGLSYAQTAGPSIELPEGAASETVVVPEAATPAQGAATTAAAGTPAAVGGIGLGAAVGIGLGVVAVAGAGGGGSSGTPATSGTN